MNSRPYLIFGKSVHVQADDETAAAILRNELALYPLAKRESEIAISYKSSLDLGAGLVNPSQHIELDDGFCMRYTTADCRFVFERDTLVEVRFAARRAGSGMRRTVRRWLDMQYTDRLHRVGLLFHENVLLPATYFDPSVALLHASAIVGKSGVILIGGTGGVGKTSLQLHLCREHGFGFMADDIAVVDAGGNVWPNLSYPKIYGYNASDNPELKRTMLTGRGPFDRLHWQIHASTGAHRVRRRVDPRKLYPDVGNEAVPLKRYVFLVRESRSAVETQSIDAERAASMSCAIIEAEYFQFHNHLHWHAFNRLASGREPITTVRYVMKRSHAMLRSVFEGVRCELVRIPIDLPHDTFKREVGALLED